MNKMELIYGDILQFKPSSWLGRLISFIDGSEYSHSALFIGTYARVPLFIESHEKRQGVVLIKLEDYGNYDVYRFDGPIRPKDEMLGLLNKKYDYKLIWRILMSKLFNKRLINNGSDNLICSELVDYAYYNQIGEGYVCTPSTIKEKTIKQDNLYK